MLTPDLGPEDAAVDHFAHHESFCLGSLVYSASHFANLLRLWDSADSFIGDTSGIFMELISAWLRLLVVDAFTPVSPIRRNLYSDQDRNSVL